jgi:hypothetical protein
LYLNSGALIIPQTTLHKIQYLENINYDISSSFTLLQNNINNIYTSALLSTQIIHGPGLIHIDNNLYFTGYKTIYTPT